MTNDSSQGFWVRLGQISLVVGIIVGLGTVWAIFRPSEYKLIGRCTPATMAVPPDINNVFSKIKDSQSRDHIKNTILSTEIKGIGEYEAGRIADGITNEFIKTIPESYRYSLPSYSSYYNIIITNHGSLPTENATLTFPFDGVALSTTSEEEKKSESVRRTYNIGTIRPKGTVRIQLWSTSGYSYSDQENFTIYHKNGTGSIEFPYTVWGFFGWLDRNWFLLVVLFVMLLYSAVTLIPLVIKQMVNSYPKSTTGPIAESEPQTRPDEKAS